MYLACLSVSTHVYVCLRMSTCVSKCLVPSQNFYPSQYIYLCFIRSTCVSKYPKCLSPPQKTSVSKSLSQNDKPFPLKCPSMAQPLSLSKQHLDLHKGKPRTKAFPRDEMEDGSQPVSKWRFLPDKNLFARRRLANCCWGEQ